MTGTISFNRGRREFLRVSALAGGGLLLGFTVPAKRGLAEDDEGQDFTPNAFLRITADGTVTVISNKSEMGQGIYTGLALLVAEELDADWNRVKVEAAPAAEIYKHPQFGVQSTGGSTSIRSEYDRYRQAAAAARAMLVAAAAQRWQVPVGECRTEASQALHDASGRSASFGALAGAAASMMAPDEVTLKTADQFRLVGRPLPRLDTPVKVTGEAGFGIDVSIPGMRTAVIARPPIPGARLNSYDDTEARKLDGIREVLAVRAGVAVVADSFWSAKRGRDALVIDWDGGAHAGLSTPLLREKYTRLTELPGRDAYKQGDVDFALSEAETLVEALYELPFLAHACMEPLNCVADVRADRAHIWSSTQSQGQDQQAAAELTGLPLEAVEIHTTFLGGGFGRKSSPDFAAEAVELSMKVGSPVKVVWTREDDTHGAYYRPMNMAKLRAGLDSEGRPVAWAHRLVGASILQAEGQWDPDKDVHAVDYSSVEGAANIPYSIANQAVDYHPVYDGIRIHWWRSVGSSVNGFVVESFIDELAAVAGEDPFEFRRKLLQDNPRDLGVLELAADKAGWGTPLPPGRARGIAVHQFGGSYVAQVAEVSLGSNGEPRVHRVVCAVDCGIALDPNNIRAQVESGIVYGLSAALYDEITLKEGRVEQGNFHDYRVLRVDEMPEVETHILESGAAVGGIGEAATPPIAPAVTNALYALTGERIRRLPITRTQPANI